MADKKIIAEDVPPQQEDGGSVMRIQVQSLEESKRGGTVFDDLPPIEAHGLLTEACVLEKGTVNGNVGVGLMGMLNDGRRVLLQATPNQIEALRAAMRGAQARFGVPREGMRGDGDARIARTRGLRAEYAELRAETEQLRRVVKAVAEYYRESHNPAKDLLLRGRLRADLFDLFKELEESGLEV